MPIECSMTDRIEVRGLLNTPFGIEVFDSCGFNLTFHFCCVVFFSTSQGGPSKAAKAPICFKMDLVLSVQKNTIALMDFNDLNQTISK